MTLFIIHGPNLNLLGLREPHVYGRETLNDINKKIRKYTRSKKIKAAFFQSNREGEIIDFLHESYRNVDGYIINPGAYTHYSYAIRDAIAAVGVPTVEVHLSDIHNREEFRKTSVISPVCIDQISGLGTESYLRAVDRLEAHLRTA